MAGRHPRQPGAPDPDELALGEVSLEGVGQRILDDGARLVKRALRGYVADPAAGAERTDARLAGLYNPLPGVSWGDNYHWTNEPWLSGATSARGWGSFSRDFIALATNIHADAFIIVNYGTSAPEEGRI